MKIDLPVQSLDSNGIPIIRKGSNSSSNSRNQINHSPGHRGAGSTSSQSNHRPSMNNAVHGSKSCSRSSSNSPTTTTTSSKSNVGVGSAILNQVVPPPSRSNHGSRTSTNSSTSSTSSGSSSNSSERHFHHHKIYPGGHGSKNNLRRVPPVPILVTSPTSSAPRADMVDYREAAAAEELAKRSISTPSNGNSPLSLRDLKLDLDSCDNQLWSMDGKMRSSVEKFALKELTSCPSSHEYSYPTVALGQQDHHSPSSAKLLNHNGTSSMKNSPNSIGHRGSGVGKSSTDKIECINGGAEDLKPLSDNKINEMSEDLKLTKKYPGLNHVQLPSKRRRERGRIGSFFSNCFGSFSSSDSCDNYGGNSGNNNQRSGTVSSNNSTNQRLFSRSSSSSVTTTGFRGQGQAGHAFKKSFSTSGIGTTGTLTFIGGNNHQTQAQYVQCKHCMEYYSPNGPPLGSLSTVNSISGLSNHHQMNGVGNKIIDSNGSGFSHGHHKPRKSMNVDECESAPDSFLNCINCLTCICAANTVLYHCVDKDDDDVGPSGPFDDSLCCGGSSCYPPSPNHPHYKDQQRRCRKRWLFLSVLSFFIPCLVCYPCFKLCHRSAKNRTGIFSSPCCCCLPSCVGGRHEPIDHQ